MKYIWPNIVLIMHRMSEWKRALKWKMIFDNKVWLFFFCAWDRKVLLEMWRQMFLHIKCKTWLDEPSAINYSRHLIHKTQLRLRLHGTGRIWDRTNIRPVPTVYTGKQDKSVNGFSVYTVEKDKFETGSIFVRSRVNVALVSQKLTQQLKADSTNYNLGQKFIRRLTLVQFFTVACPYCGSPPSPFSGNIPLPPFKVGV